MALLQTDVIELAHWAMTRIARRYNKDVSEIKFCLDVLQEGQMMGWFSSLFSSGNSSSLASGQDVSRILSRLDRALLENDYDQVDMICASPISIESSTQNQAARLFLQAYNLSNQAALKSFFNQAFGGTSSTTNRSSSVFQQVYLFLLNGGLSPDAKVDNVPLIHVLIENLMNSESVNAIDILIKAGANVNALSKSGNTALGAFLIRDLMPDDSDGSNFVGAGAKLSNADLQNWEFYKVAFQCGLDAVVDLIPKHYLEQYSKKSVAGVTLLHYVAGGIGLSVSGDELKKRYDELYRNRGTYPKLALCLLNNGADIEAKTYMGYNAEDIALKMGHMGTYDVLRKYRETYCRVSG